MAQELDAVTYLDTSAKIDAHASFEKLVDAVRGKLLENPSAYEKQDTKIFS
eukprot:SAG31_NODE_38518_length_295_cov_1.290816_1_plen_51_part_01